MQYTKEEVRKRILDAARAEFFRRGYEGAAMRSIAAAAGSSPGNLYRYYENKQELYCAVVGGVIDECVERTHMVDISPEGIERTVNAMVGFVGENNQVFKILVSGPAEYYTDFLRRFSESLSQRLRAYAASRGGEAMGKIINPGFFDAVALGCIASLRPLMESFEDSDALRVHVLELWRFLFADFIGRLENMHGPDVSL